MAGKELKLEIPAPNIQVMKVRIVGTNNLIFHRWSEKAKRMILDKQQKKAPKGREIRDPETEAQESYYIDSEGRVAFPALSIKQAVVSSARNIESVTMAMLRGAVFIIGDKDGLIPVEYAEKSTREDMVRVGMGTADLRYRGQVSDWSMEFLVKFNADVLSPVQVLNLLQTAGFSSGLGEWRPEKNGDFGTFTVESTSNSVAA